MIFLEKIHVVIPVHNRKQYTLGCLASLYRQMVKGFRIIVVDDGSTDGTSVAIAEKYPDVTVLCGDGNLWWSGAMNLGVSHALNLGAEYIISLNNDLEVAEDYIGKMIYWAERKPEVLLGSYAFDIKTGRPDWAGNRKNWKRAWAANLLDILPEDQRKGIHSITHFCGRGLWIPAKVFREIGLFDAKYLPLYAADDDFTFRASESGYEVYCNLDAKLYSYTEESVAYRPPERYTLKGFLRSLFHIKGRGNMKNCLIIAFRHCPKRYLPYYLLYSIVGRIVEYPLNWIKDSRKCEKK